MPLDERNTQPAWAQSQGENSKMSTIDKFMRGMKKVAGQGDKHDVLARKKKSPRQQAARESLKSDVKFVRGQMGKVKKAMQAAKAAAKPAPKAAKKSTKGTWEDPVQMKGQTLRAGGAKLTKKSGPPKLPKNWRKLAYNHPDRVAFREWFEKGTKGQPSAMVAGIDMSKAAEKIGSKAESLVKGAKKKRAASMKAKPKY